MLRSNLNVGFSEESEWLSQLEFEWPFAILDKILEESSDDQSEEGDYDSDSWESDYLSEEEEGIAFT